MPRWPTVVAAAQLDDDIAEHDGVLALSGTPADKRLEVAPGAGRLARAAAAWDPLPPHGWRAGTCRAWAAPPSVVGLLWGLLAGGRPTWDRTRGMLVLRGVRGLAGLGLDLAGARGATIGHVVLCRSSEPTTSLLDHEAVHVRQFERLGPLFVPVYGWWLLRFGYGHHPFEVAARRAARRLAARRQHAVPVAAPPGHGDADGRHGGT